MADAGAGDVGATGERITAAATDEVRQVTVRKYREGEVV